jgi:cell division protein FtsQ
VSRTTAPERPRARVPVDPRVRARWIAARRAEGRRRLWILVAIGAVALLAGGAWLVASSPLLDVDRVVVKGTVHTPADQVTRAAGVHRGDAMVWLDGGAAAERIDGLPWVRRARVDREWPGTVRITVTERVASAWVDTGDGAALVDPTGRVLERVGEPPAGLPQLDGVDGLPSVGGTVDPPVAARGAGHLTGLARSGTRTVTVTPTGVVLGLVSGPELRLGAPTAVDAKVRAALAVLGALDGVAVAYIDVSVPSNPIAGPPI